MSSCGWSRPSLEISTMPDDMALAAPLHDAEQKASARVPLRKAMAILNPRSAVPNCLERRGNVRKPEKLIVFKLREQ